MLGQQVELRAHGHPHRHHDAEPERLDHTLRDADRALDDRDGDRQRDGRRGTGTGTVSMCATAHLTGALSADPQGGSAGHSYQDLVLTNHGATCTLQGWPGTSLVGTSGNQLGAAATFVTSSPHGTVTLATNGTAKAVIAIAQAGDYGSSCTAAAATGFRIYPPGQKAALFVPGSRLTACTQTNIKLLTVTAFQ